MLGYTALSSSEHAANPDSKQVTNSLDPLKVTYKYKIMYSKIITSSLDFLTHLDYILKQQAFAVLLITTQMIKWTVDLTVTMYEKIWNRAKRISLVLEQSHTLLCIYLGYPRLLSEASYLGLSST